MVQSLITNEHVIVSDTLKDDRWKYFQDLAMFNLAYGVSASTGEFFYTLVDHLCKTLEADYVLIVRMIRLKNKVETLALSDHGKKVENFIYDLKTHFVKT